VKGYWQMRFYWEKPRATATIPNSIVLNNTPIPWQPFAVTEGQVRFEMAYLQRKLQLRDPARLHLLEVEETADLHPLFYLISGSIADWEKS
jgi:hypothetical protein